jgi:hypothetical protein
VSADETLLHRLLPSFLWLRDDQHGRALAALVSALAEQHGDLRTDLERLYRDLFIETCRAPIVPLIGENVGVVGPGCEDRAWVGQIVGLRRGKGTLAAVARGVAAATGWGVFAQDARRTLGRTQSLLDPDPHVGTLLHLADARATDAVREPWSQATRRAAVCGRPVIAGVHARAGAPAPTRAPAPATATLGVWRLMSFRVTGRTPCPANDAPSEHAGRAFRIDPLGRDVQLFTAPVDGDAEPAPAALARPLDRAELSALLRRSRTAPAAAPLTVRTASEGGPLRALRGERLGVADLRRWAPPAGAKREADAVVDPARGRLLLLGEPPTAIDVDYAYGFSGELGGGPYGIGRAGEGDRRTLVIRVARSGRGTHRSLAAALATWRAAAPMRATISLEDSATDAHTSGAWRIALDAGVRLQIASTAHAAPVLDGDLHTRVPAGAELRLHGVTVGGAIDAHGDGALALEHTTVAPRANSPCIRARAGLSLSASHCILGSIHASDSVQLALRACIVDGSIGETGRPLGTLDAAQATVLGTTVARVLLAEDCIFAAPLTSTDPARGAIRTSFLPARSTPPQLIACLDEAHGRPRFTSTRWGAAGYCQLAVGGPPAIATGAAHGGELGAFNWLDQPARFQRLSAVLHELLPAGVGAAIELHT